MTVPFIEVYSKKNCGRCVAAKKVIDKVLVDIPFEFKEVDVAASADLKRRFEDDVPTVFINGKKVFKYVVDEEEFRKLIRKEIIKAGFSKVSENKKLKS
ncbi:MAG: glutaredoxin family protein [Deltaproteobacteria bacterium]|nr:glutaredoxin family protein [Deltaproteobacteria bacterium]